MINKDWKIKKKSEVPKIAKRANNKILMTGITKISRIFIGIWIQILFCYKEGVKKRGFKEEVINKVVFLRRSKGHI